MLTACYDKTTAVVKFFSETCFWMPFSTLSGDVQTNPGPVGSLNFWYQNVRGLKANYRDSTTNCVLNKLSCLQDVVYGNSIDVIALTETWLSNHVGLLANGEVVY